MKMFLHSRELHLDPRRLNFIRAVAVRQWIVTSAIMMAEMREAS